MDYLYHNDEPAPEDILGRRDFVRQLGNAIYACRPPEVFAVQGDWGSGKTSLLAQLQWYLSGTAESTFLESIDEARVPDPDSGKIDEEYSKEIWGAVPWNKTKKDRDCQTLVWFEAWRYQQEPKPIVALLQEIRSQIPLASKFWNQTKKLSATATKTILRSFDSLIQLVGAESPKAGGIIGAAQKAGEEWEAAHFAEKMPTSQIREQLRYAIDQALYGAEPLIEKGKLKKQKARRLVVIIDDLDRCEPEVAYALLEGIKIYLSLPNCIFVLGVNARILQTAIEKKLGKDAGGSKEYQAREYLEKLCQQLWHVPILTPRERADLVAKWLPAKGESPPSEAIVEAVREFKPLPANFRKIKKFCNIVIRHLSGSGFAGWETLTPDEHKRRARLAVLMSSLYYYHPAIYRQLEDDPKFYRDQLIKWVSGSLPPEDEAECFEEVKRTAAKRSIDEKKPPTEEWDLNLRYPDPSYGNVFRLEALVKDLGNVTETELLRWLFSAE